MNRRFVGAILTMALLLSATPWEAWAAAEASAPLVASQSAGLHAAELVSLAVESCCVCLCPFTSSLLHSVFSLSVNSPALLLAPWEPLFSGERSFADPPLRLVFHPPRRA